MTETLDVCWGLGATLLAERRAVETSAIDGPSFAQQIEDRPPRRWRLPLPAEPHHRLRGYARDFWRRVLGPVVPFYWTPPDAADPILVRFVGPLTLRYDGPGRGATELVVEEAFGL